MAREWCFCCVTNILRTWTFYFKDLGILQSGLLCPSDNNLDISTIVYIIWLCGGIMVEKNMQIGCLALEAYSNIRRDPSQRKFVHPFVTLCH